MPPKTYEEIMGEVTKWAPPVTASGPPGFRPANDRKRCRRCEYFYTRTHVATAGNCTRFRLVVPATAVCNDFMLSSAYEDESQPSSDD